MTRLTEQISTAKNLYCDAYVDNDQLTLLYDVKPGVCGKSFGLDIAKLAGLPTTVLEKARLYLDTFNKCRGE